MAKINDWKTKETVSLIKWNCFLEGNNLDKILGTLIKREKKRYNLIKSQW